jgi:hypothetical protein
MMIFNKFRDRIMSFGNDEAYEVIRKFLGNNVDCDVAFVENSDENFQLKRDINNEAFPRDINSIKSNNYETNPFL